MRRKLTTALLTLGCLVLAAPGFAAPPPQPAAGGPPQINVYCSKGQLVQDALDRVIGPSTLVVTGICTENLVINKDDVTLQGGTYMPLDSSQNTILVQGARRVLITGVNVTGGRNGIVVYQGGSLTVDGNSTISGATQNGVVAVYGSSATVNSSTIQGNVQGVTAADNSALVLTNSVITNNTGTGVLVIRSSSARIGQNLLGVAGLNTITDNAGSGVSISRGSNALVDGNTITGNSSNGVDVEGASATVTNNLVSGSTKGISVHNSGSARIGITDGNEAGGNTVENNSLEGIQIANGAAGYIYYNTITNNGANGSDPSKRPGVGIYRATGRLLGRNTISNNTGHGVEVDLGALFQGTGDFNLPEGLAERDIISQNGFSGISGWNGARLDLRQLRVENNTQNGISLGLRSSLRIYDATVLGSVYGIAVYQGSAVIFSAPAASITGSSLGLYCAGTEASYDGNVSAVVGISPDCTGF